MSEQRDDGGPVFPIPDIPGVKPPWDGMALRDYLAAQVLLGLYANSSLPASNTVTRAGFVEEAYKAADEMLEARKK